MVDTEDLNISKARNQLTKTENKLELYLTKKVIAYNKTQPGSTNLREIVVQESNIIIDKFNHYMIKNEDYDETIYELVNTSIALQQYIANEISRLKQFDAEALRILEYREKKYIWPKIALLMHMDERTCRRKIGLK